MDEDRGDQHILMNTSLGSLGTEQMGISSTQSNHISSKNTKQGQGSMLAMLSAENQRKDDTVSPLSPAPYSDKHPCDPQNPEEAGKEIGANPPIMGSHMHPFEAQKPTSLKKPLNKPSYTNEPTNTPLSPRKGNLKRVARVQGRRTQNANMQTQSPVGLLGSKRAAMHECLDENVSKPQKKQHESYQTEAQNILERSAVAATHHRRDK